MQNLISLIFMAAGAVIFYCGFIAGHPQKSETSDELTTYVCPTKLEPAPTQKERERKDEEEVKSYFYQ